VRRTWTCRWATVLARVDRCGAWVTGPNPGYGFSARRSSGVFTDDELSAQARDFLATINPDTGYLD
jgi:hypothetical protein